MGYLDWELLMQVWCQLFLQVEIYKPKTAGLFARNMNAGSTVARRLCVMAYIKRTYSTVICYLTIMLLAIMFLKIMVLASISAPVLILLSKQRNNEIYN